jgi:hypothetical protein
MRRLTTDSGKTRRRLHEREHFLAMALNLLLIDDNPPDRIRYRHMLRQSGEEIGRASCRERVS